MEVNKIYLGDCIEVMRQLPDESVDVIVTSPPYAMQRKNQYGGIPEKEYPEWTVRWMQEAKRILKPHGSVLINIRPHIRNGVLSDYMLKTRLALRQDGWIECDELIWYKPDAPPLGHPKRPRRGWESIHWFAKTNNPYCDPRANGKPSKLVGFRGSRGVGDYIASATGVDGYKTDIARCHDVVVVPVSRNDRTKYNNHPARYPVELAAWLIRMFCPPGGVVYDPFIGSGSTAIAALKESRFYIGSEIVPEYVDIAERRIKDFLSSRKSNGP